MSYPDVPIRRFNNVNKSCKVILGNPPIDQGLNSPQLWGPRLLDSPIEVDPSELLSSWELV